MVSKVTLASAKPPAKTSRVDLSPRPLAFVLSSSLHCAFIALLMLLSADIPAVRSSAVDKEKPAPFEGRRIIWYRFKSLPRVAPSPEIRRAFRTQADANRRRQTVITQVPPSRDKRFVWTPAKISVPNNRIPLPDTVQTQVKTADQTRTQRKPQLRKFQLPNKISAIEQPSVVLTAAEPITVTSTVTDVPKLPVSRRRAVFPPTPVQQATAGAPMLTPPDQLSIAGASPAPITGVVVNAIPVNGPPVPRITGSAAGDVSNAATTGRTAAGNDLGPGTGEIPGLALEGKDQAGGIAQRVSRNDEPVREIVYQSSRMGSARNSLSVPLRPNARSVPAHVEAQFARRDVYTMLLPMSGTGGYASDWVVWFGDRSANAPIGRVKAPLPLLKRQTTRRNPGDGCCVPVQVCVLVVISTSGRITNVRVLRTSMPVPARDIEEDLKSWEFRPATRDGEAFETEALFDFALNAPAETQASQ